MGKVLRSLAPLLLCATLASAGTITFTEVPLPSLTLLTNQYSAYAVTFADSTYYAIDSRFPGGDDRGITTTGGQADLMTVVFTSPATSVTFDWVTVSPGFHARAYDGDGNLLSSYDLSPPGTLTTGTGALGGGLIVRVQFFDDGSTGQVGVGTLGFTPIPEPASLFLVGLGSLGLVLLALFRRRGGLPRG